MTEQTVEQERDSWKREARIYRDALIVAENALEQNVTMCTRARKAGIQNAAQLQVVTEQAVRVARRALEPWSDSTHKQDQTP